MKNSISDDDQSKTTEHIDIRAKYISPEQTSADQLDCSTHIESSGSRFVAYLLLVLCGIVGQVSMVLFALFLFHGSLNLVNLGLGETKGLWLNACLSLAFFLQHSVMIRRPYRQWLAQFIRVEYHGALYTIISGAFLLIIVVFWQKSANTLAAPQDILRWMLHVVYFLSIAGIVWGIRALGSFDPFGFSSILCYLRGKKERPVPFIARGPYCWVRHPLYLFSLLMIWSCPDLTLDRLLFNVLWTAWIIVGAVFEERDLVASYGEAYRSYQSKVPMLIPYRIRPAR